MNNQAGFILKVLLLSAVLSILIKYVGPSLAIGATPTIVLIAVFTPSVVMAIALLWRFKQPRIN